MFKEKVFFFPESLEYLKTFSESSNVTWVPDLALLSLSLVTTVCFRGRSKQVYPQAS